MEIRQTPDPCLAVARVLTPDQLQAIVKRFTDLNPHWRGAEAADILDELDGADSDLNWTEPLLEKHPDLCRPGAGVAIRALVWSGSEVNQFSVRALMEKAGL